MADVRRIDIDKLIEEIIEFKPTVDGTPIIHGLAKEAIIDCIKSQPTVDYPKCRAWFCKDCHCTSDKTDCPYREEN